MDPVKRLPDCMDFHVIYVKEEKPPKGKEGIEWFLTTSESAGNSEEAYEYVGCWMQRWKTGRFHYALKSGCGIEKLQERSIEKSMALILMHSIIAVMILNMTYATQLAPEFPCPPGIGGGRVGIAVSCGGKEQEGAEESVHDKRSGRLFGLVGMAETGVQWRASRSEDGVARADEVIYFAGLPGAPRVILWVKFSAERQGIL
jgi:hypothetical protein